MHLIKKNDDLSFFIDPKFHYGYLKPISEFVTWKLESQNWDDYNELFHATSFFESIKSNKNIWVNTHLLYKNNMHIGSLFIIGGEISNTDKEIRQSNEKDSLLLKYFHIVDKNNGYGSLWLNQIIIPHYKTLNFKYIFVNSSHPKSFNFYKRIGTQIQTYQKASDNKIYNRIGNSFKINL